MAERALSLARFETTVGLVNDHNPTAAANNAVIAVTLGQRLD